MKKILAAIVCIAICFGCVALLSACNGEKMPEEGKSGIYYIEYNGVRIELGKDAKTVIDALGKPKSEKELGDCGGLGAQIKYSYNDIDVYSLKNDDGETIDQISFTSDIAQTPKGIYIGADATSVTEAYGQPTEKKDGDSRYISGNFVLKFKFEDGIVSAIEYIRITQK